MSNQPGPLPVSKNGMLRCGHCGGNLHLQPGSPVTSVFAAQLLAQAFGIKTIADLGNNKFFRWAQGIAALAD